MFDPNSLKTLETNTLEIVHPVTGDKTGWIWTLSGPKHPTAIHQKTSMINRTLKRSRLNKEQDADSVEVENVAFLVERTLGWTGAAEEFSPETATRYLSDPAFNWLRGQVNKFLSDEASFIETSATA